MILLILTSAVLFTLAFPNLFFLQGFSFLSWFFAVPFFFCLEGKNFTGRLKAGFLFGLLSNLAAVNWMISYSVPGYVLLSLALSVQAVIFAALYQPSRKYTFLNVFYVAALWVVSEYARKWIMLGESWNLAHCRSFDVAFMQIANVLGSSVISFVLIGMNYAIYNALKKSQEKQKRINGLLSAVILVAGAYSYGFITLTQSVPLPDGPLVKVCVLQTDHDYHGDLPEDQVNAIVEQNIILTRQAVAVSQTKPDLIVWPETSIPTDFLQDPALNAKMTGLAQEIGTNLLIGAAIQDADGQHNSAVLLDSHGEVRNIYHKRHLIPLTEFIPDVWPWKIFANIFSVKTPDLVEGQRDASGIMEITLRDQETVRFGVAICSEDNIDRLFYEYRRQGARFVVVLLNNGWFTQKAGFVMHAQHSIVRAIENHFPVIRSSNHGWSGMINQWGATSDESFKTLTEKKFFSYEFAAGSRKSVPNNLGDIFCVLCIGFVILMKLYTTIREKK